jgi:hypothetical protein
MSNKIKEGDQIMCFKRKRLQTKDAPYFGLVPGLAGLFFLALGLVFSVTPAMAAPGDTAMTPANPTEVPVEIEVETGIGSLKQAPLWKELIQLLEDPYLAPIGGNSLAPSGVVRRPGFGVAMPLLNAWPLGYNFLTGQPLWLRTSDGEPSWDQPGPLFDPDEVVATSSDPADPNVPIELRTVIGELFVDGQNRLRVRNPDTARARRRRGFSGTSSDPRLPSDRTIVGVPAVVDGVLFEGEIDPATGEVEFEPVVELEVPVNEEHFIRDRRRAEELGKALFWDMQVGSDGVQACGSCHFAAGVDPRTRNQLNPNTLGGDLIFDVRAPDEAVVASDFPFHKLVDSDIPGEPLLNPGNVASDANDVMSSMGVVFREFVNIRGIGSRSFIPGTDPPVLRNDIGLATPDPIPGFQDLRRVEPRNTPTMHSAAFNFDNFWDGRARFHFNGGSVFGPSDPFHHVFVDFQDTLQPMTHPVDPEVPLQRWFGGEEPVPVRIKFSSLASQAVGPPLSDFEMSFLGRSWAKIGKKLLQDGVTPLANQLVATDDSRLGRWSNQGGNRCVFLGRPTAPGKPGLCTTYPEMIQAAFRAPLWRNTTEHLNIAADADDPFDGVRLVIREDPAIPTDRRQLTQMEANFALFFGLAVQAYEELLIPDDTPFDQFLDANPLAGKGMGQAGEQAP